MTRRKNPSAEISQREYDRQELLVDRDAAAMRRASAEEVKLGLEMVKVWKTDAKRFGPYRNNGWDVLDADGIVCATRRSTPQAIRFAALLNNLGRMK